MQRFFVIAICLAVTASASAAPPRSQPRADKPGSVLSTAIHLLEARLRLLPFSDELTPPIPAPDKRTRCCR